MLLSCYPTPDGSNSLVDDNAMGIYPSRWKQSSRKRIIIAMHGDETLGTTWTPAAKSAGFASAMLADKGGYFILAPDFGGAQHWGKPAAVALFGEWLDFVMTVLGSTSTKVGLMPWSMGGLLALNALKAYTSKIAGALMWNPALDIRFFNSHAVAYSSPYSAAYAGSAYNGGSGGTITPNAGQATEIAAAYPSGFASSDPMQNIASFRDLGVPVRIVSPSDDNGVPPGQASYFVSQVNDPDIALRTPQPVGAHNTPGPMGGTPAGSYPGTVPEAEVRGFFDGLDW